MLIHFAFYILLTVFSSHKLQWGQEFGCISFFFHIQAEIYQTFVLPMKLHVVNFFSDVIYWFDYTGGFNSGFNGFFFFLVSQTSSTDAAQMLLVLTAQVKWGSQSKMDCVHRLLPVIKYLIEFICKWYLMQRCPARQDQLYIVIFCSTASSLPSLSVSQTLLVHLHLVSFSCSALLWDNLVAEIENTAKWDT